MASYLAELAIGQVVTKSIGSALAKYRVVNISTASNVDTVAYAGAGERRAYGRTIQEVTSANYTSGRTTIDVQTFVPGDEVTLIASEALSSLRTPVAVAANGKIAALTANATPTEQYCFAENLETTTADGDEVLCRILDKMISY